MGNAFCPFMFPALLCLLLVNRVSGYIGTQGYDAATKKLIPEQVLVDTFNDKSVATY